VLAATRSAVFTFSLSTATGEEKAGRASVAVGFAGTYHQKVDGKGRVSVPLKMRRVIEGGDPDWDTEKGGTVHLVFGSHLKGYVQGYTVAQFARLEERILSLKESNPMRDRMQRMILGKSTPLDVDKSGRTILPKEIREKLGIDDAGMDLRYVGLGDRFEVWPAPDYVERVEVEDEAWLAEQGEGFNLLAALAED